MDVRFDPLVPSETPRVEAILRSLPDWFGIEEALLNYVKESAIYPTWLARVPGAAPDAGFLTLHTHFPAAAEVHCMAIRPEFHRQGIGRAMIAFAAEHLRAGGVRFLQVKTLSPRRMCAEYERTRAFYLAVGFTPMEEFLTLWPGNPALQLIMAI